jgi:hypothetical protein
MFFKLLDSGIDKAPADPRLGGGGGGSGGMGGGQTYRIHTICCGFSGSDFVLLTYGGVLDSFDEI